VPPRASGRVAHVGVVHEGRRAWLRPGGPALSSWPESLRDLVCRLLLEKNNFFDIRRVASIRHGFDCASAATSEARSDTNSAKTLDMYVSSRLCFVTSMLRCSSDSRSPLRS